MTEKQKKVSKKMLENVRNKKPKNKGDILKEIGYKEISKQPNRVLESKGVQEGLKPFVDEMILERNRLIASIKTKDLNKVVYEKAVGSLDTLTKNIQLLSGGETEISKVKVIEIINPNEDTSKTN